MAVVRNLVLGDWARLWPLIEVMGTARGEFEVRGTFIELVGDERWYLVGAEWGNVGLVGYAAAQDYGPHLRGGNQHRTVRLHDLAVSPSYRRRGTGRDLLAAVTEWAGQRARYLEWQAHADHAAPFYEALGYRGDPCPQPEYPTFEVDLAADDRQ